MDPAQIKSAMNGKLEPNGLGLGCAYLPAETIQNHAAYLTRAKNCEMSGAASGPLQCVWFGGALEGKSDICIYRATFDEAAKQWSAAEKLSDDPDRSEQNPVLFYAPDGRELLLHTAQPGGNQDACRVRMREVGKVPHDLELPRGTFVRAPIHVRGDGAWLLPLFMCVSRPGQRWTGSHDIAAVAISADQGLSWRVVEVPGSLGCVHMSIVPLGGKNLAAFFRRRQADYVYRTVSADDGESWCSPEATNVPNNNSSISVVKLADGRLAMACNPVNAEMSADRRASLYDELADENGTDARPNATGGCAPIWGVARAPMAICLSADDGKTFSDIRIVEAGPGTCLSNDSIDGENLEMSYPFLSGTESGGLDLAYTYHRRAIKHVRLTAEWLAKK